MSATGTGGTAPRVYRSLRREMQARRTRARIIAAAAQRFLAHGYAGAPMRAVALNAGVALPTVELAFRTKARLLKAVIDVAIAGDDDQVAMLDRQWAKRAASIAGPPDFVAAFARVLAGSAERAAGWRRLPWRPPEPTRTSPPSPRSSCSSEKSWPRGW